MTAPTVDLPLNDALARDPARIGVLTARSQGRRHLRHQVARNADKEIAHEGAIG